MACEAFQSVHHFIKHLLMLDKAAALRRFLAEGLFVCWFHIGQIMLLSGLTQIGARQENPLGWIDRHLIR